MIYNKERSAYTICKEIFYMSKSMAEQVNSARLMLSGMKAKAEELKAIGITEDDITKLSDFYASYTALDEKQEKLKAELKTCTVDLAKKGKDMNDFVSAMKKRVKLVIPQTEWSAFGITSTK